MAAYGVIPIIAAAIAGVAALTPVVVGAVQAGQAPKTEREAILKEIKKWETKQKAADNKRKGKELVPTAASRAKGEDDYQQATLMLKQLHAQLDLLDKNTEAVVEALNPTPAPVPVAQAPVAKAPAGKLAKTKSTGLMAVVKSPWTWGISLVLTLAAGGAYYYFKKYKKNPAPFEVAR